MFCCYLDTSCKQDCYLLFVTLRFSAARRDGNDVSSCKSMNYDNAICAIKDAYGGVRRDIQVWVQTSICVECRMADSNKFNSRTRRYSL